MKKIYGFLQLLLPALVMLALVYGGLTILDLKNQNQNLNQKQKQLEKQIVLLKNKFNALATLPSQNLTPNPEQPNPTQSERPKKIAGVSATSSPEVTTQNNSSTSSDHQDLSSPQPSPEITPTPAKPKSTSKPSPSPKPSPTPTPTPTPRPAAKATVSVKQVGDYQVNLTENDTAFTILLRAGEENGFTVEYQMYDFGAFITCIAEICPTGNQYWAFYYNGAYSMVGASAQEVKDGDTTAWKIESF